MVSCNLSGRDLEGRQAAACPSQASSAPTPTETRIPKATMTFDYARLRQGKKKMSAAKQQEREQAVDQLFASMCKGLKARGQTSSATFTFTDDKKVKADNRAKAGCTGSPAQNIQGGVISSFKQLNKMETGQHYQLEISGYNCVTGAPIRAATPFNSTEGNYLGSFGKELLALEMRDLLPGGSENGEMESFPPFTAEDTSNTIIHSVGDLPAGTYTINTRINEGTVSSLRVIDYLGDEYASANIELGPTGQESLSFTLDNGGVGFGFFMDTQLDFVNISSTMLIGSPSSAVSWSRASVGLLVGIIAASVGILFI
ncbi:hypothetical protein DXG01_002701 [Tephrocybe rancida]|nr:hypothetical protein DXG01_002701 [Tephrocybe rancida]